MICQFLWVTDPQELTNSRSTSDETCGTVDSKNLQRMNTEGFYAVEDVLYPSDNLFDIPTLRTDRQAGFLALPLSAYGTGRKMSNARTIHFYVDDYRFEALWKVPAKLLATKVKAIVEPNFSTFDTMPLALGIQFIYKKRWLARYYQENGIDVYADLNVSSKFYDYNRMGIPDGYNAFATRGYFRMVDRLESELAIARQISECDCPNLIVYGGGQEVKGILL
jgi:gene 1 protein